MFELQVNNISRKLTRQLAGNQEYTVSSVDEPQEEQLVRCS